MPIIISNEEGTRKIEESKFEAEHKLQEYIYDNPEVLPIEEIEEEIPFIIVAREVPTNSGPIDALGFDSNGNIYVIETKLYNNSDKRKVMAQVMDYGAALWKHTNDFGEFMRDLRDRYRDKFDEELDDSLVTYFDKEEDDLDEYFDNVKQNLDEGKYRFVILMDRVDSRLKDLILFMNQNSRFDIYAVELDYYKFDGYHLSIPKIFGAEVKKSVGSSSGSKRRTWDEESFFEDAKNNLSESEIESIKILYEFSKRKAKISWGTGTARGSFNPKFSKISTRSLYTVFSDGTLQINFGWLSDNETTEKYRDDFKKELEKFKDFNIPNDYKEKYPILTIEKWAPKVNDFIMIVDELISR